MSYETMIGLEVHAQLLTRSKMFCGCSADYAGAPPNTYVCPVCLGMPGVLPVINRRAVEFTLITGLALSCEIPEASKFDRKNYPYPDLPKGYQISQYDLPFTRQGWLEIEVDDAKRRIGVERVHLEEDTARLTHVRSERGGAYSLLDFNRSGVPLMESVSAPDLRSPGEARVYLVQLRAILRSLRVSTGDMEKGQFRVDANVSVRPEGSDVLGTKVEIKNMNSFRSVERALAFEIQRQSQALEAGQRIEQETRGWIEERGVTVSQRSKEFAHDYRYFPEPDLPPLLITREWVTRLKENLPELPEARRRRFAAQYGLSAYDAQQLGTDRAVADFFEAAAAASGKPKQVANWVQGELFRLLNEADSSIETSCVTPQALAELVGLVEQGVVSTGLAKQVFQKMFETSKAPQLVVEELGLTQISGETDLQRVIDEVIASNPRPVADYRAGKVAALGFLKGQVMKATAGKANPAVLERLLREKL